MGAAALSVVGAGGLAAQHSERAEGQRRERLAAAAGRRRQGLRERIEAIAFHLVSPLGRWGGGREPT
jgi:hypothetical protein